MKKRKIPMRICVGCQERKEKKQLLRIVRTVTGSIEFDPTGKKPGRGAYICPTVECLSIAQKKKRLEKSLQVTISDTVYEGLKDRLTEDDNK
ncbi:MAG TPA: YlxR family protein [Firmicutes bacterium]|nr:YlxR family protein [Bacillota bacterium]